MTPLQQIAQQAEHLSPVERLQLVDTILQGLELSDPAKEAMWAAEGDARYEAYKRGELEALDWEEIRKTLPQ